MWELWLGHPSLWNSCFIFPSMISICSFFFFSPSLFFFFFFSTCLPRMRQTSGKPDFSGISVAGEVSRIHKTHFPMKRPKENSGFTHRSEKPVGMVWRESRQALSEVWGLVWDITLPILLKLIQGEPTGSWLSNMTQGRQRHLSDDLLSCWKSADWIMGSFW